MDDILTEEDKAVAWSMFDCLLDEWPHAPISVYVEELTNVLYKGKETLERGSLYYRIHTFITTGE